MLLKNIVQFSVGASVYRLKESSSPNSKLITFYGQNELQEDLYQIQLLNADRKQLKLNINKSTLLLKENDIIFSLISGVAAIVLKEHENYLCTQNYVKIIPSSKISSKYLVYLLNESKFVKKQFFNGLQGSSIQRYTLAQLNSLRLPSLPSRKQQELIGNIYLNGLKLKTLKEHMADLELKQTLKLLERVE